MSEWSQAERESRRCPQTPTTIGKSPQPSHVPTAGDRPDAPLASRGLESQLGATDDTTGKRVTCPECPECVLFWRGVRSCKLRSGQPRFRPQVFSINLRSKAKPTRTEHTPVRRENGNPPPSVPPISPLSPRSVSRVRTVAGYPYRPFIVYVIRPAAFVPRHRPCDV